MDKSDCLYLYKKLLYTGIYNPGRYEPEYNNLFKKTKFCDHILDLSENRRIHEKWDKSKDRVDFKEISNNDAKKIVTVLSLNEKFKFLYKRKF